jgi:protein ImuB
MERLSQLAEQAGRFTPTVSLQPPQALLLEISASLRIFGGLAKLKMELSNQLFASGAGGHVTVTPTPSASLLLASQGQSAVLLEQDALRSHLGKLPVGVLPLDPDAIHRLIRMGVRTLHDLWRLPRQGLARRFGPRLLDFLDRALGLLPDPRPIFHPSPRFAAELELPYAVDDTPVLLTATGQLIAKLVKFLRERDAAVSRLQLDLCHIRMPPSRLQLGTRHGTHDAEHLMRLLEEHLRHFRLPAPVIKLGLTSAAIQPFTASNRSLFARHESSSTSSSPPPQNDEIASGQDWQQVIEQLQARLGREAVQGLEVLADHRPEQALKYVEPGSQTSYVSSYRRPLWLLPAPQPLPSRQGRPRRRGLLSIASGPERVESGWWDDRDVHRDYYIASDTDGSRLWIFHDLRGDHTWYLHGLFG